MMMTMSRLVLMVISSVPTLFVMAQDATTTPSFAPSVTDVVAPSTPSPVTTAPATTAPATTAPATTTPVTTGPTAAPSTDTTASPTIPLPPFNQLEYLATEGDYNTLLGLLETTGLDEALIASPTSTLFAPTDDAFDMNRDVFFKFVVDSDTWFYHLECVLLHHVVADPPVLLEDLSVVNVSFPTLDQDGEAIVVVSVDPVITLELEFGFTSPSVLNEQDILTNSGPIHSLDNVFIPACAGLDTLTFFQTTEDFSILAELMELTGLIDNEQIVDGPGTVFPVPNAVFEALPDGLLTALKLDIPTLTNVLSYHFVPDEIILSRTLVDGTPTEFSTLLSGESVSVLFSSSADDDSFTVNTNADIINRDELVQTGVGQVINNILIPDGLSLPDPVNMVDYLTAAGEYTTLLSLLEVAGLSDFLSTATNLTLFAPTDDALFRRGGVFAKFVDDTDTWNSHLACVLLYHLVPGKVLSSDLSVNATLMPLGTPSLILVTSLDPPTITLTPLQVTSPAIQEADILTSTGPIHSINDVLLPLCATTDVASAVGLFPSYSILNELLQLTGLDMNELLAGEGPVTVFAPTDDAFEALPDGLLDDLKDDIPLLTDILLYHVAPGLYFASDLEAGVPVVVPTALEGQNLTMTKADDESVTVMGINDAMVTNGDLLLNNGVAHDVSSVLLYPGIQLPTMAPSTMAPTEPMPTSSPTSPMPTPPPTASPTPAPTPLVTPAPTPTSDASALVGYYGNTMMGVVLATLVVVAAMI